MENVTEEKVVTTQMVIASKHQAAKYGDEPYNKDQSKLLREEKAVPYKFVARINDSYVHTGIYFEINHEATKEFYIRKDEVVLEKIKAKEIKDKALEVIAASMSVAKASTQISSKKKTKSNNNEQIEISNS